jgi:hypothetical protein
MDVESITSDDVGDVVSNHGEYRSDNQADVSDAGTGEYYVVDRLLSMLFFQQYCEITSHLIF